MKRTAFLVLAALTLSTAAAAQSDPLFSVRLTSVAEALTESAPTLVTQGMDLNDVEGYRIIVCAASGQTLSGAGTLNAYVWDNDLALWVRNPSLDVTVGTASVRCLAFPDLQTIVAAGRVFYAATGVTVSSGTLVVHHKAWAKRGPFR